MKKFILMVALGLGVAGAAHAQISTGEVSSKVIRTGNRAQQGNFGLYLGATTDMFKAIGDDNVKIKAIPLINLKYMQSDNLEYRLGIEWFDKYESNTTDNNPVFNDEGEETGTKSITNSESESRFMFYPGVAYHFSNKNLLDVYVGGELPIGWGTKGNHQDDEGDTASMFRIGLGAFVGLQAYIANLPLALGVEYGISTVYNHFGTATTNTQGYEIANIAKDQSANRWKLGNQVRVTLSYYFNK